MAFLYLILHFRFSDAIFIVRNRPYNPPNIYQEFCVQPVPTEKQKRSRVLHIQAIYSLFGVSQSKWNK